MHRLPLSASLSTRQVSHQHTLVLRRECHDVCSMTLRIHWAVYACTGAMCVSCRGGHGLPAKGPPRRGPGAAPSRCLQPPAPAPPTPPLSVANPPQCSQPAATKPDCLFTSPSDCEVDHVVLSRIRSADVVRGGGNWGGVAGERGGGGRRNTYLLHLVPAAGGASGVGQQGHPWRLHPECRRSVSRRYGDVCQPLRIRVQIHSTVPEH